MMFSDTLSRLGLAENEAKIYEILLLKGETKARDLLEDSGLSRGNVYNMLTSLTARGFIQVTEGKQQTYRVTDPTKLSTLVDERKRGIERLDAEFKEILPHMLSTFSLTTGRPTVRVFEGIEGAEEATFDTLSSTTEIFTYYDFTALHGRLEELDEKYYRAYVKKGLRKTIVVADSPEARAYFAEPLKNTRVVFVPNFPLQFYSAVQIYGESLSFVTLKDNHLVSVIIQDRIIANFMRQMFTFHVSLGQGVAVEA